MSLIKRSYSDGHKSIKPVAEIIKKVEPENQKLPKTKCQWCTSTIRCTMSDFQVYKGRKVIFLCPVCGEYSRTDCVTLEKVKWFQGRMKNDWFVLPK
jgi:predicted RNA-binding Zn-ribbon protein involved in translation (DUF1610 family)